MNSSEIATESSTVRFQRPATCKPSRRYAIYQVSPYPVKNPVKPRATDREVTSHDGVAPRAGLRVLGNLVEEVEDSRLVGGDATLERLDAGHFQLVPHLHRDEVLGRNGKSELTSKV